jgi:AraC-like DNA-binding protein
MVRLNLIEPLLQELRLRRIDSGEVLARLSIRPSDVADNSTFIPAPKMYAVVETLAEASGDPHFGVRAGEKLDPWAWPPMLEAARLSGTVGEFLLRFMENARQDESSATYILKTVASRTTFHERRSSDGGVTPRHNDGFTLAYLLTLIRQAVGDDWNGSQVVARCCDPAVIPDGYLGIRTAATDNLGASLSFPTVWLIRELALERPAQSPASATMNVLPPGSFVEAFRQAIQPHLHEFDLDMDRVSKICGFSKRTLARRMKARGTSVRNELGSLRRERAESALRNTTLRIGEIAASVGYSDAAVFSRAFKRWNGLSPRAYRAQARKELSLRRSAPAK